MRDVETCRSTHHEFTIFAARDWLFYQDFQLRLQGHEATNPDDLREFLERSWSNNFGLDRFINSIWVAPSEKSFTRDCEFLQPALNKALADREEARRELAEAARAVDRSALGKEPGFGQAHQALLKALERAGRLV